MNVYTINISGNTYILLFFVKYLPGSIKKQNKRTKQNLALKDEI